MKRTWMGLLGAAALLMSACGPGGGSVTGCDPNGTGDLVVNVSGLPGGVSAKVSVTGPSGFNQNLTGSQTFTAIAAGTYTVTADKVANTDPLIRTAYSASVNSSPACVRNGQATTVNVSYTQIPTSNKLWMDNDNLPSGSSPLLGFAASLLSSTATQSPSVSAGTVNLRDLTFDKDGNLWGIGGTTADPNLVRYPASSLGSSGSKTSDRSINIGGFSCSPGPTRLAFDASGNLWVMAFENNVLYQLTPTDQSGSGSQILTPAIQVSVPVSAVLEGMAFDEGGGLWITYEAGKFARLSPAQLGTSSTSGSPTNPERIITSSSISSAGGLALYPAPAGLPLYHRLP